MSEIETPKADPRDLLGARMAIAKGVVFRSFPAETVVLNLSTGLYHGLNPSAGQMLEAMTSADSVADAAREVASGYGVAPETVEADMCDLCRALLERGLIEARDGKDD